MTTENLNYSGQVNVLEESEVNIFSLNHVQNAIAVSACFHTHKQFGRFYEKFGPDMNGFIGIYNYCNDIAKLITDFERQFACWSDSGTKFDWPDITEILAAAVIRSSLDTQKLPNLKELFNGIIEDAQK